MAAAGVLKCPFPYFGGKRMVADLVWRHFGEVSNFVEPFAGSCAVLLSRPRPFAGVETVNDANAYVTNFWRATSRDPEAVVEACDWPVNELDLHARHRWLVLSPEALEFRERMRTDPDHFDAKIAGWWVWGACAWIGGEWCRYSEGTNQSVQIPHLGGNGDVGRGVHASGDVPAGKDLASKVRIAAHNEGSVGKGVHAKGSCEWQQRPEIAAPHSDAGRGVHGSGPELSEAAPMGFRPTGNREGGNGRGIHGGCNSGGRPQLADAYDVGRGVHASGDLGTCALRREWLLDWFCRLQDRLRLVRVCCGHWLRVCDSESVTTRLGTTAVFLDPPYPLTRKDTGKKSRSRGLYQGDEAKALDALRDEVLAYCIERGGNPQMRLCVACYEGDGYETLEKDRGWKAEAWKAQGGYGNRSGGGQEQRKRERLLFSPHCVFTPSLFDSLDAPAAAPEEE